MALSLLMGSPCRAENAPPSPPPSAPGSCDTSDLAASAIAAGTAMVAAGMALMAREQTVAAGVALVAAGMALTAQGMACQAAVDARNKASADAAERSAVEAQLKQIADDKAASDAALAEERRNREAEQSALETEKPPGKDATLAVGFAIRSFNDCVLDLGERVDRASGKPTLPETYTVNSYCRRMFPHEIDPQGVRITLEVKFHFENREKCQDALTAQMINADAVAKLPEEKDAELFCTELFSGTTSTTESNGHSALGGNGHSAEIQINGQ